ncbi:ribose 5-phosphate isomerase B [Candidatus Methylocalor cossyra]|uniref:Sugar phosphate isomerase YwlF n=1 Tax=Candidatus Methylocalor cossyra TaxID=3108543 RepID=A0ABM9NHA9_9GAMM
MKIGIASDHAGFSYKEALRAWLQALGHEVIDFGCYSDASTDYPQWIRPCAEAVARGAVERGIVLGGSGNGEAIVANRIKGCRCGYCFNEETAFLTRAHNDANCIAIGQRLVSLEMAKRIVELFLATPFEGGRHIPRIAAIDP